MDRILKKYFDKFMERGELPPEIREYSIGNGYKFSDKAKLSNWRSNQKGIQYRDKTSGILLRGVVDNLLEKDKVIPYHLIKKCDAVYDKPERAKIYV